MPTPSGRINANFECFWPTMRRLWLPSFSAWQNLQFQRPLPFAIFPIAAFPSLSQGDDDAIVGDDESMANAGRRAARKSPRQFKRLRRMRANGHRVRRRRRSGVVAKMGQRASRASPRLFGSLWRGRGCVQRVRRCGRLCFAAICSRRGQRVNILTALGSHAAIRAEPSGRPCDPCRRTLSCW